ncbi:MAG: Biotin synthase [Candidatus Thorarchaeota archaeon AB_25]|nr:MAG: Biotin synthase [Candidatus Thorarchaeota archaeon AB_25]
MSFDIIDEGHAVLKVSSDEFEEIMKVGLDQRLSIYGNGLLCYSPTAYPYEIKDHTQVGPHNFVSLSVTGTSCSLKCEHCDGRLLKGMESTITPENLFDRCQEIKTLGGEGVLISGGSDSKGYVPLERFTDSIQRVKSELNLEVVVHTGLVSEKTAQGLAEAQIDAAMLDIIGDERVSREVYHIEDGPRKMRHSLDILEELGIPTVPHILVGLDYGKLAGEIEALDLIAQGNPAAVVIIALSPLRKTPMEGVIPPAPEDIGRIMTVARLGMKEVPILLGCARPMGNHKIATDKYAILSGVNGIALISQEGVDFARENGLKPTFLDVCCSLAYKTLI